MKTYQMAVLVQREPLRLAFVMEDAEGCSAGEVALTIQEARGLGLALLTEAAREQVTAERTQAEVAELDSVYCKDRPVTAKGATPENIQ